MYDFCIYSAHKMSKKSLFANWPSLILFAVSPDGVATGANNALIPLLPNPLYLPPSVPANWLAINNKSRAAAAAASHLRQTYTEKGGGEQKVPSSSFFSFFVEEPVNYSWVEIARWRRRFGNPAAAAGGLSAGGEDEAD